MQEATVVSPIVRKLPTILPGPGLQSHDSEPPPRTSRRIPRDRVSLKNTGAVEVGWLKISSQRHEPGGASANGGTVWRYVRWGVA